MRNLIVIPIALAALSILVGCGSQPPSPTITHPTETALPVSSPQATLHPAEATNTALAISSESGIATLTAIAQPTPTPRIGEGPVGERVAIGGVALTVHKVMQAPSIWGGMALPNKGDAFLIVDLTLENTGTDKLSYSCNDFAAVNASGLEYRGQECVGPEPQWEYLGYEYGDLAPGQEWHCNTVFTVPAGNVADLTLWYNPALPREAVLIRVPLQ